MTTKEKLIAMAKAAHGVDITPCSGQTEFAVVDDPNYSYYTLWYNTPDNSTHVVRTPKGLSMGHMIDIGALTDYRFFHPNY